jgi:hypothetical protein
MRVYRHLISIVILLGLFCSATPLSFAADKGTAVSEIDIPTSEKDEMALVFKNLGAETPKSRLSLVSQQQNPVSTEKELFKYNSVAGVVTFNKMSFKEATRQTRNRAVEEFVSEINASSLSLQTQQYLFDRLSLADSDMSRMLIPLVNSGTNTDMFTAFTWIKPALPVVRAILGVATLQIFFLLVYLGQEKRCIIRGKRVEEYGLYPLMHFMSCEWSKAV